MTAIHGMHMYSLTLQPPSYIIQAVVGNFSGQKEQEVLTIKGSRLEIFRTDLANGRLASLHAHDTFSTVRTIQPFRLAGGTKDYIIAGSDSGRITILEYDGPSNRFKQVHLETFGKSGVRRMVPGQFLAVDPKGRAVMITSVEKNKLVYVLNRDSQANLTISSPLEAHKSRNLIFSMVSMDVGYENPQFAALEVDYSKVEDDPSRAAYDQVEKALTFYELDLGLNHVVKKWSDAVDRSSNFLIQIPGGQDGPSGVLVCAEDSITYRYINKPIHTIPIPRRRNHGEDADRKRNIISAVMHKMKGAFFVLAQTEDGDLFKITLDYENGDIKAIYIKYFDTVAVANSICILKSGYLFVAAEGGNHHLYQFEKLGDNDDETVFSSMEGRKGPAYFSLRPLENLILTEEVESMNPTLDAQVLNLTNEDAPQIYALCGRGARSSLRTLRHGLDVSDVTGSELPGAPNAIWTTKSKVDDDNDSYIVLSFSNGTLVLSIGETVEEVTDSGFLSSVATLALQQIGEDALLQIYAKGIRHIRADKQVNEWKVPQNCQIVAASTNTRQIVVALSTAELVYFEMDNEGQLNEFEERKQMSGQVLCLSVGEVPYGRQRNPFLAVGCDDYTVRIISLDPDNTLENLSVQALSAGPSDLRIMMMDDNTTEKTTSTLYLHIGLVNGVYLRTVLDNVTGQLSDTRTRFLGPKAVKLFQVVVLGKSCVLALSSRTWLGYTHNASFRLTPLSYVPLEYASSFRSEQCPEGIVAIQGQNLRIFNIERLNDNLKQEAIPLSYTPRKFVKHPTENLFFIIESEQGVAPSVDHAAVESGHTNGDTHDLDPKQFGYPHLKPGRWASCIRIVDPVKKETVVKLELDDDEAAFSQDDEGFLVVGTSQGAIMLPKSTKASYLHIYRLENDGRGFEFIHKTRVEEPPLALLGFQGRLLAAVGNRLRIYEIGQRQLLRKCELRLRNSIVNLQTQGNRIVAADNQMSVSYVVYKFAENLLIAFADDIQARHVTCSTMIDYETTAGGDRFGNLWIVRCPKLASEEADEDDSGAHLVHEKPYLMGAPHRLDVLCHFHPGDIPISIQKTQLVAGGKDVLVYSCLMGTIGCLIPFVSKEDVEFFQQLEGFMRSEDPPLTGRDHLAYRSYYIPSKSTIDGDLCERYSILPLEKQRMIANELDRTVREVERKVSDMRSRAAF